jgi:hypothetical protein
MKKLISFFVVHLLLVSCNFFEEKMVNSLNVPAKVLEIQKLVNKGEVTPDFEAKKMFFSNGLKEDYISTFSKLGYGYRINELVPQWNFYFDNSYFIIIGTVAKNKQKAAVFITVYNLEGQPVYSEFRNKKTGDYPEGIIPN